MGFDERFEALWHQQEFEVPARGDDLCRYAQSYAEWVRPIVENAAEIGTGYAVNIAMLRVTRQFFEWRMVVPKSHRERMVERGHTCIFHVFEAAYLKLKMLELAIQPPPITVPIVSPPPVPPPPPPPPPSILGITLGEVLGEE